MNFSPRPHFFNKRPSGVSYLFFPMAVAASLAVNIFPRRASHSSDFCAAYSLSKAALTLGCMLLIYGVTLLNYLVGKNTIVRRIVPLVFYFWHSPYRGRYYRHRHQSRRHHYREPLHDNRVT